MSFFFTLGFDEANKRKKCSFLPIRDDILTANERDQCVCHVFKVSFDAWTRASLWEDGCFLCRWWSPFGFLLRQQFSFHERHDRLNVEGIERVCGWWVCDECVPRVNELNWSWNHGLSPVLLLFFFFVVF